MTTKEILTLWDSHFAPNAYPQAWVLRLWRTKYTSEQLAYAFGVALRTLKAGRLQPQTVDDLSRYITGVARHRTAEDVVIEQEIADHISEQMR